MSLPSNVVNMLDPQVPVDQGIYEESTTQKAALGTRLRVGERTYYYAKALGNLTAANVVCAGGFDVSACGGLATIAVDTAALGKTTITCTVGTSAAANAFADGYLSVASIALSGGGLLFKIKSHPAIVSGAVNSTIILYDSIPVNTMAAGPIAIVPSPFAYVTQTAAATEQPIGVAPIAVTSGNYFWMQTYGPSAIKAAAANAAGAALLFSTTGGAAVAFGGGTTGPAASTFLIGRGIGLAVATATQASPVFLTILP